MQIKNLINFILSIFIFEVSVFSQVQPSNDYKSGNGGVLSVYQKYISPVKGGNNCPMYPSCSQYAKIEFANKNPVTAYFEVCDRLIRCGNDLNTYPEVQVDGLTLYKDTVSGISFNRKNKTDTNNLFIDYLEKEEDFQSATLEYKRLLFYEKDSSRQSNLLFRLAVCCYIAGNYEQFSKIYDKIGTYPLKKNIKDSLALYQSLIYCKQKDFINAGIMLSNIKPDNIKFKSDIKYLQGLCSLKQHKWEETEDFMKQVLPISDNYSKALLCYNVKADYKKVPLRKPFIALSSSIILPGSGYFYAKKPMTGFTAIILNGLFIWTAADALKSRQYGLFSVTCLIGTGWYFGSVLGSWKAVTDCNNAEIDKFISNKTNP